MLPKINNKSLLECSEEDFDVLKDNPDYRENEYMDYKEKFAFLEIDKGKERNTKIAEFKSDVCAFANAEGGYLIFGISDENGCAKEIIGIDIPDDNTDKFELDRRNNLNGIYPRTPYVKFSFVKLQNGRYIVVIFIKHDNFAPYTHIENEKSYIMYKCSGNGKKIMSYSEMKNMFNQSLSLEKEIYNYRKERIDYYKNQEETENEVTPRFMLVHVIPETFLDSSYNQNMFIINKTGGKKFSTMFSNVGCNTCCTPCVDGLRFIPYGDSLYQSECYINNNGVVECYMHLDDILLHIGSDRYPEGYIPYVCVWEMIEPVFKGYAEKFKQMYPNEKVYMCVSIVGCKDIISEFGDITAFQKKIDRNIIQCAPVIVNNLEDDDEMQLVTKKLYIEFLLSIGVTNNSELKKIIQEVYDV